LSTEHQAILDTLTAKLNKTTQDAVTVNMKEQKAITDVASDPFYQVEILKPKMLEDEKNYYVHLEIAPHEKEDVHLMAHGREIRITLSKKYSSTMDDADGSVNRTSKTQLYSKEFPTKEILNSKQISQKYENGILSFKIAKL
jgi:HSP20 family molecular chaperone IbpA